MHRLPARRQHGRRRAARLRLSHCDRVPPDELDEADTERVLQRWATRVGYREHDAVRAIRAAFAKTPQGTWRYHPPGLVKKPGTKAGMVLAPICADVDCPANCPPLATVYRGLKGETFARFEQLGWPLVLRRSRRAALADWYRAICELERERNFAPGAPLFVTYRQLAERAGRNYRHAGRYMQHLLDAGLLAEFLRGSGDGPHARNRVASHVRRRVPIPTPQGSHLSTAITTGGDPPPHIGGLRPLSRRRAYRSPDEGGRAE